MSLKNIKLGVSALGNDIMLYRHGKEPSVALERRHAEAEVMAVLVEHMLADMPKGAEKVITLNGKRYTVTVKPLEEGNK